MEEVINLRVVRPYVLNIEFADGKRRQVDVKQELHGKVFEPLKDPEFFGKAKVEGGTVAWPNGADFSPEFLYHDAKLATTT